MKVMKISGYISVMCQMNSLSWSVRWMFALMACVVGLHVGAQNYTGEPIKPTKYIEVTDEKPRMDFFQGFTLSGDLFGPIQYLLSDYGSVEGALRLNLKNTYFPIAELGYGACDKTDGNTNIRYKTNAPFLRVGFDINFLKDKYQDNRLYAGLRYGLSTFNYDISGPELTDPIWGGSETFNYSGLNATCQWIEFVVGVQVKIWKNFHMGWSLRMKRQLSTSRSDYAEPYYIPGYGAAVSTTTWGGTYNLIFDLNWGKKKKGVKIVDINLPALREDVGDTIKIDTGVQEKEFALPEDSIRIK